VIEWTSSHPAAKALLADLLQAHGKRDGDEAMRLAGVWLASVARRAPAGMQTLRRVLDEASRPAWPRLEAHPRPAPPQAPPLPWWRRWLRDRVSTSVLHLLLLCNGALPPHALTALRRPTRRAKIAAAIAAGPIEPICRLRSPEGMARVAREAAAETAAEIASFPRGTGSPPEDILRCLRRPWWFQQRVVPAKQRSAHYLKAFAHLEPIPEVKAQKEAAAKASTEEDSHLGDFIGGSCVDPKTGAVIMF
jgi:hypothetical protein